MFAVRGLSALITLEQHLSVCRNSRQVRDKANYHSRTRGRNLADTKAAEHQERTSSRRDQTDYRPMQQRRSEERRVGKECLL